MDSSIKKCGLTKQVLSNQYDPKSRVYFISTDGAQIKIWFITQDIVRVRASFDGEFREESYALSLTAWPDRFDDLLGPLRTRVQALEVEKNQNDKEISFKGENLLVKINKKPYNLQIYNSKKQLIYSDIFGRAHKKDLQGRIYHYSSLDPDNDFFYGFGENTGPLNKNAKILRQAPKDALGYDAETTAPLYKHIPFYIKLNKKNKHAVGLFYNNTFQSYFDMGCQRNGGYWPRYTYFCADGGDLDLYIINGPQISKVVERYTDLTGKTAFHPMESLGYLGSTMYYPELPENCDDEILSFIDKNHKEGIPISNFHLSSGYAATQILTKRCVFTWNKQKFPNPEQFFEKMNEKGVSVSPNIKPGILTIHPLFKDFEENKALIMTADKKKVYFDQWWGGDCAFIDFTSKSGRQVWKKHMKKSLIEKGARSIWNDNSEYESVDDRGAYCDFDGKGGNFDELKPVLALLMSQASYEALHEANPNLRPFVINRSGYAGFQKYASSWSGDNMMDWKTIRYNISTILNIGLCGVANYGCDIGGFFGPAPSAQLFVRWVQNGIFHPRFSIHSGNTDNSVTEPWMYGSVKGLIAQAIRFRYTLIPYLYSLLYEAQKYGNPIMRPLIYEFQDDINCYNTFDTFMLGKSLLVASVLEKGAKTRTIYFPKGCNWHDFWGNEVYEGGTTIEIPVQLKSIPLFLRGSAIVPTTQNFKDFHKQKIESLKVWICWEEDCQFTLFEDDGKSYEYKKGQMLETQIKVKKDSQNDKICIIQLNKKGKLVSTVKQIELLVKKIQKIPVLIKLNNDNMKSYLDREKWEKAEEGWHFDFDLGVVKIKYPNRKEDQRIVINFDQLVQFSEEI